MSWDGPLTAFFAVVKTVLRPGDICSNLLSCFHHKQMGSACSFKIQDSKVYRQHTLSEQKSKWVRRAFSESLGATGVRLFSAIVKNGFRIILFLWSNGAFWLIRCPILVRPLQSWSVQDSTRNSIQLFASSLDERKQSECPTLKAQTSPTQTNISHIKSTNISKTKIICYIKSTNISDTNKHLRH